MARDQMVVDHADRLHKGVDDGRPDEFKTVADELLRHRARDFRFGRGLTAFFYFAVLRLAAEMVPQEGGKSRAAVHDIEVSARRIDRAFDLGAIAHNAGVLHQPFDFLRRVARDLFRIEFAEGAAEVFALAQNRDPRQPGLEAVEHQLLVERAVIPLGHAPFFVVIGDVKRIGAGPGAACKPVGVDVPEWDDAEPASPGQGNFAQSGFFTCSTMPPASNAMPLASASATRSRRSSARPRPLAVEPSVPTCLPPAITGIPGAGENSS